MTTATAEKPTCKYQMTDSETMLSGCKQLAWTDQVKRHKYCPNCGKKIDRLEREEE